MAATASADVLVEFIWRRRGCRLAGDMGSIQPGSLIYTISGQHCTFAPRGCGNSGQSRPKDGPKKYSTDAHLSNIGLLLRWSPLVRLRTGNTSACRIALDFCQTNRQSADSALRLNCGVYIGPFNLPWHTSSNFIRARRCFHGFAVRVHARYQRTPSLRP
jgi:hypothetical protein